MYKYNYHFNNRLAFQLCMYFIFINQRIYTLVYVNVGVCLSVCPSVRLCTKYLENGLTDSVHIWYIDTTQVD